MSAGTVAGSVPPPVATRGARRSLRAQLLGWMIATLLVVIGFNLATGFVRARESARLVIDNMLLSSARVVAEAVRVEPDGDVAVDVPPAALELFATGHRDQVYYRVTTPWGRLVAGYADLSEPSAQRAGKSMTFRGASVRAIKLTYPVVGLGADGTVDVTIAVTRNQEAALRTDLWLANLADQALLMIVAGLVTVFGLRRGLAPVLRLREEVRARRRDQLEPFDDAAVHTELRPLVQALNDYMRRVERQVAAQRRFVSNAAHQLRTPLTLLSTQASFAAREADAAKRDEALQALVLSTRQVSRLAEQLLTLTRAEPGSRAPRADRVDMTAVARQVLEAQAEAALRRDIDIGLEADGSTLVTGDGTMLKEMVVNLVDNALRYTPPQGSVTVTVRPDGRSVVVKVEDTGPGIAETERERVFERFYRIIGTQEEGSGLGLAIVREVAVGAGGTVVLGRSAEAGLAVTVTLPGAAAAGD